MMNWKYVLFLPLVLMIGCVEKVNERFGPEIDVYPVTFSIALSKSKESDGKLSAFFDKYENEILNHGVKISWFSTKGKKWADKINKELLKNGVNKELIILSNEEKKVSHFDIKLSLVTHKVQVTTCEYANIGTIGNVSSGCFVENARWSSMVNPQKMLLEKTNSNTESGE